MRLRIITFIIGAIFCPSLLYSATNIGYVTSDSIAAFSLGDVTCIGFTPADGVNTLSNDLMTRHDVRKVDEALCLLPGLTVRDAGARGEGIFYLRGFDQRGVPIMLDGVPIYIPYEAQLDIRRLSTLNLANITVEKGAPSLLAGANAMGGVVNLVSSKPTEKLELKAGVSTLWDMHAAVGTKLGNWYAQGHISYDKRNYIRLPHSFEYVDGLQESRHLINSDRRDLNLNVRAGFAPGKDEYSVGYSMIRADKGVPVYLGVDGKPRFWRYDPWDKDEFLIHTHTAIGKKDVVETRLFYDKYYNVVRSFDDISCTTQGGKSSFNSTYDDYALGAVINWHRRFSDRFTLKGGANYKHDMHRSRNDGEPTMHKSDDLFSMAIEGYWEPMSRLKFTAGAGLFGRYGAKSEDYEKVGGDYEKVDKPLSHDTQFNYQFTAAWHFTSDDKIKLSAARTSRFPTLSERYTYKFGKSLPNPDLRSEHSFNFDLTVEGLDAGVKWSVSGFCSLIDDVIQDVTGVDPDNPTVFQPRNCDRARFIGWEAALSYRLFGRLTLSGNYSYISRVNTSDRSLIFTDVPRHKGLISAHCELPAGFGINADWILSSGAYSTSDGSLSTPGYVLINLKAYNSIAHSGVKLEVGVKNLLDKLYYYTEGYPQEGRLIYAAVSYNFTLK